jgi:NADH-quinone oxidoreductase subunit A
VVNNTVDLVIQFGLMIVLAAGLFMAMLAIVHYLMPSSKNPNKGIPYECGVVPETEARLPYNVHYYLVAVLFVLFDLEAVFIYPWAVNLRTLGTGALVEMFVFIAILLVGFLYAWKKGVFEWE